MLRAAADAVEVAAEAFEALRERPFAFARQPGGDRRVLHHRARRPRRPGDRHVTLRVWRRLVPAVVTRPARRRGGRERIGVAAARRRRAKVVFRARGSARERQVALECGAGGGRRLGVGGAAGAAPGIGDRGVHRGGGAGVAGGAVVRRRSRRRRLVLCHQRDVRRDGGGRQRDVEDGRRQPADVGDGGARRVDGRVTQRHVDEEVRLGHADRRADGCVAVELRLSRLAAQHAHAARARVVRAPGPAPGPGRRAVRARRAVAAEAVVVDALG